MEPNPVTFRLVSKQLSHTGCRSYSSTSFSTSIIFYKNFYRNSEIFNLRTQNRILLYVNCKIYFSKQSEYQPREICQTCLLLWFNILTTNIFFQISSLRRRSNKKMQRKIIISLKIIQHLDSRELKVICTSRLIGRNIRDKILLNLLISNRMCHLVILKFFYILSSLIWNLNLKSFLFTSWFCVYIWWVHPHLHLHAHMGWWPPGSLHFRICFQLNGYICKLVLQLYF